MPQQNKNVSYSTQEEETLISVHKQQYCEYKSLTDGLYKQDQQQLHE